MAEMDRNPITEAFELRDIASSEMHNAIDNWHDLYREPYTDNKSCNYNPHLAIASTVVSKLNNAMFGEYTSNVEKDSGGRYKELLKNLDRVKLRAMQAVMVGGECLIKPIPNFAKNTFTFAVIPRTNYNKLGKDELENITDVGTYDVITIKNAYYTLAERRRAGADGKLTIDNVLFKSEVPGILGDKITLNSVEHFSKLKPSIIYGNIHSIGLIQMRLPTENMVDNSDEPVSIYARSVGTIKEINEHEAQYKKEFKNAQSRLLVSEDRIREDVNGNRIFDDDLFILLDENPQEKETGITIFNPDIRDESFQRRENDLMRIIENQNNLARGILSDVNFYQADKTATEVNLSKGEFQLTINNLYDVWTQAVLQAFALCDVLGRMFFKWTEAAAIPVLDFGDGVLYDRNKVFTEMFNMVSGGVMRPEMLLAWYNNIKWDADDAKLIKDIQKMMPTTDDLLTEAGDGAL